MRATVQRPLPAACVRVDCVGEQEQEEVEWKGDERTRVSLLLQDPWERQRREGEKKKNEAVVVTEQNKEFVK